MIEPMLPPPSAALDRRQLLLAGLLPLAYACSGATPSSPSPEPRFRISLAQWSFHRRLQRRAEPHLDPLDFAAAARRLGFDAIEYVNAFYKQRLNADLLLELKKRAADQGVRSLLIMCDGEGALGDPDERRRLEAVHNHYKWVDAAAFLGCHSIRVNAQSSGSRDEQGKLAADGLRRLCEYADPQGLNVIVENHGGLSSDGSWLAGTIRLVRHARCGTLPDFGNFRIDAKTIYDRYLGVRELMPYAKAVSAKSMDFDSAGNETTIDYLQMLKIVAEAGYRGWIGVEYEGQRLDEEAGILATKRLLERCFQSLGV
jgi:sugar phosphate isomerase/epimerase